VTSPKLGIHEDVLAALDTITPSKKWWGARRTIAIEYRLCPLAAQHVSFGLVLRHYMSITLMAPSLLLRRKQGERAFAFGFADEPLLVFAEDARQFSYDCCCFWLAALAR
jgi:hypothetical protein